MQTITANRIMELTENDSGIRLLRSKAAPFMIPFLYNEFHVLDKTSVEFSVLESKLVSYLERQADKEGLLFEDMKESGDEEAEELASYDRSRRARRYITDWYSEAKGYLRRYRNDEMTEILELSAGVQRLFSYLDRTMDAETIGTESSFQGILLALRQMYSSTSVPGSTMMSMSVDSLRGVFNNSIKHVPPLKMNGKPTFESASRSPNA